MANTWSDKEIYETLKTYMVMLKLEQNGKSYSKKEFKLSLLNSILNLSR